MVTWELTNSELGTHYTFNQTIGNQQFKRKFPIYSISNPHFTLHNKAAQDTAPTTLFQPHPHPVVGIGGTASGENNEERTTERTGTPSLCMRVTWYRRSPCDTRSTPPPPHRACGGMPDSNNAPDSFMHAHTNRKPHKTARHR